MMILLYENLTDHGETVEAVLNLAGLELNLTGILTGSAHEETGECMSPLHTAPLRGEAWLPRVRDPST